MPDVTIQAAGGGQFGAYLAIPDSGRGPGIVVCQEIFGVNAVMRDICDGLASQGYTAICPDLFWRQEPGIQITDKTDAEWQRAFALFNGFDLDKGMDDLAATLAFLRGHAACSGKAGAVGYCLGGRLAYHMATRTDADCSVSYYGVGIESVLDEAGKITRPLMLHIAEKDQFVPPEAQAAVKAALSGNPQVTAHSYAGQDHAFARVGGAHWNAEAAGQANDRTAAFFAAHLGA